MREAAEKSDKGLGIGGRGATESVAMVEANPIKLSLSIFTGGSEALSQARSPRSFEQAAVGLGIVAAMNGSSGAIETKIVVSPRSDPIPIVSAKGGSKFKGLAWEAAEEAAESYTCVISRVGEERGRKREYFDRPDGAGGTFWGGSGVFCAAPPPAVQGEDFLSTCYLCRKKLQGLDIFMYRGEKAFCSSECRYQQILSDEIAEKCGSEAMKKPFESSVSPCSAPRIFSAGIAAA